MPTASQGEDDCSTLPTESNATSLMLKVLPKRERRASLTWGLSMLSSDVPAMVVNRTGTILAFNSPATWLVGKDPDQLMLDNIYEISARALRRSTNTLCCNQSFLDHKLAMYDKIDPDRQQMGHRLMLLVKRDALKRQHHASCELLSDQIRDRVNDWSYPLSLVLNFPDGSSEPQPQLFMVSDVRINPLNSRSGPVYIVVFDPATKKAASVLRRLLISYGDQLALRSFPEADELSDILQGPTEEWLSRLDRVRDALIAERWSRAGEIVRSLRSGLGLTAGELATQVGVSRPYVSLWEAGKRPIAESWQLERLIRILRPRPVQEDELRRLARLVDMDRVSGLDDRDWPEAQDKIDELARLDRQIAEASARRARLIDELAPLPQEEKMAQSRRSRRTA